MTESSKIGEKKVIININIERYTTIYFDFASHSSIYICVIKLISGKEK